MGIKFEDEPKQSSTHHGDAKLSYHVSRVSLEMREGGGREGVRREGVREGGREGREGGMEGGREGYLIPRLIRCR